MKLDNKGWGMAVLLLGIGVLMLGLLISVVIMQRNIAPIAPDDSITGNSNTESYQALEQQLLKAAQAYTDNLTDAIEIGTFDVVTLKQLRKKKYIGRIKDIKGFFSYCDGYVIYQKGYTGFEHKAYLTCGNNYQTEGYVSGNEK